MQDWSLAVCSYVDPEIFFPAKGVSPREARRICAQCSIKTMCLEEALSLGAVEGIWAGTTPKQRQQIARERPKPPKPKPRKVPRGYAELPQLDRGSIGSRGTSLAG